MEIGKHKNGQLGEICLKGENLKQGKIEEQRSIMLLLVNRKPPTSGED